MNFLQFVTTLVLALTLAGLSIWNAAAAQNNISLAKEQARLQGLLTNARTQQGVLKQVLQRTVIAGQGDPEILDLLTKYGFSLKEAPVVPQPTPSR